MHKKQGVAVIFILFIITIAAAYSISLIRMISYTTTISCEREQHISYWYKAELLVRYAESWLNKQVAKPPLPQHVVIPHWPLSTSNTQGEVVIIKKTSDILIKATIREKNKSVCVIEKRYTKREF